MTKKPMLMPMPESMPYIRIFPNELLQGDAYEDLTSQEFGCAMRLLFAQIQRGGVLPTEPRKLARIAHCSLEELEELRQIWPELQPHPTQPDKFGIPYVNREWEWFKDKSNTAKENAEKKYQKNEPSIDPSIVSVDNLCGGSTDALQSNYGGSTDALQSQCGGITDELQ